MGHGSSALEEPAKELSVSYLDVVHIENVDNRDIQHQQMQCLDADCQKVQCEEVKNVPHDADSPARLRSSADSECSTAAPSEDEGDMIETRTSSPDVGTPLLCGVAEDGEDEDKATLLEPLPLKRLRESTYLIFDWDDTLLPTGFVMDAVKICPPKYGQTALNHRGPRRGHVRVGGGAKLAKDFPCYEALKSHAALVERLLTAANGIARVAIVTSASRPWVFESAEQYLPGLNFAGLLKELEIPVYYASEHRPRGSEADAAGAEIEPGAACKRNAMAEFLQQASEETGSAWNIISVGDSQAEKDAVKLVIRDFCGELSFGKDKTQRPLCKTVKLMTNPSLKHLSEELLLLAAQLERLACHNGDFDLCVAEPGDLNMQADALLGA